VQAGQGQTLEGADHARGQGISAVSGSRPGKPAPPPSL
jgi:hypothetical protein